eukprot:scaffold441528_cov40-Prasinocladus_malaysianus.AAC.2
MDFIGPPKSTRKTGSTETEAACLLALAALLGCCSLGLRWWEKLLNARHVIEMERQAVLAKLIERKHLICRGGTAVAGEPSGR